MVRRGSTVRVRDRAPVFFREDAALGASVTAPQPAGARGHLPIIGLVLSAAAWVLAPAMVSIGLYMPIFDAMDQTSGAPSASVADSFGHFGAWAVFPILLTLPGLVVSLIALLRTQGDESGRGLAIAGVVCGGLAFLAVSGFTLVLYAGVL